MATKTTFTFRPIGGRQVLEPRVWNETQTYIEDAIDEILDALAGGGAVVATRVLQEIAGDNTTQELAIVDSETPSLLGRARMIFGTTAGGTNSNSYISFWTNQDGLARLERLRIQPNGLVSFGGITSGFPALKRSSATLEVRTADDGGLGTLNAQSLLMAGQPLSATLLPLIGGEMTGQLKITIEAATASILAKTNGGSGIISEMYAAGAPSAFLGRRTRGTIGTPTNVLQNDELFRLQAQGNADGAYRNSGQFTFTVIQPTPAENAMQGRFHLDLAPLDSGAMTEILRLEHATGLSMFGANPVIDQNRHRRTRSYTIGTLPTPAVAGEVIQVSDLGGGSGSVESTGAASAWRRRTPGYGTLGNADATVTVLTEAENLNMTATLTANRVITLSSTRAYVGARFVIRRTGLGAFTLTIDNHDGADLFVFASGTGGTAIFVYNGTDWVLMGSMS